MLSKKKIGFFYLFLIIFTKVIYANEYELLDKIVVIVEKDIISESEIKEELNKKINLLQANEINNTNLKELEKQTIQNLIEKKLIIQYAQLINLTPSNEEIEIVFQQILTNNKINQETLKIELEQQGQNIFEFKDDLKFQLTLQKIKDKEIAPFIKISDYEIEDWLNKNSINDDVDYRISHIIIKKNNPEITHIIDLINEKLKITSFENLALEYSDGPNKDKYGDLGWNKIQDLPDIFKDFIIKAAENEISKWIESDNGFHLLKMQKIKKENEEIKETIKQYKFQQILLKPNPINQDDEIQKKMNYIKNQIDSGLDFSDAVKLYSEDQFNLDKSNLEWINFDNLLPDFRVHLLDYAKEKLIGPFKTDFGWHLIKVYDFREKNISDNLMKEKARVSLIRKKIDLRYQDWVKGLIQNSTIKYLKED